MYLIYTALFALLVVVLPNVEGVDPIKCAKRWIKKDCRDNLHQDLLPIINDVATNSIDWDDYAGYLYGLACRCREAALLQGHSWFALGNYGMCFVQRLPLADYLKSHPKDNNTKCIGTIEKNKTLVTTDEGEECIGGMYRAFFYEIIKDDGVLASAPQAAEEIAAEEEAVQCSMKSDVMFVIDSSGSIGDANFNFLKTFLIEFINRYDFAASRLGIITYDKKCYVNLLWLDSEGMSLDKLRSYINKMVYTSESTLTDNALMCARDKMIIPFQRKGVPITMFIVTDGVSFRGDERLPPIAKELQEKYKAKTLAIGVGSSIDPDNLLTLAGDASRVFKVSHFKNLMDKAAQHLNNIISKACA